MKYFLDCGYYVGIILDQYLEGNEIDKNWKVYAFEPSHELGVEESIKRFPFDVEWVDKAVWTTDGEVEFWISQLNNSSYVDGIGNNNAPEKKITVDSIDFSKFVGGLKADKIICSMDIEGAEFPVLEKMIEDNTIDKLDILDIEFHNRVANVPIEETHKLYKEIEKRGVEIRLKIPVEGI